MKIFSMLLPKERMYTPEPPLSSLALTKKAYHPNSVESPKPLTLV